MKSRCVLFFGFSLIFSCINKKESNSASIRTTEQRLQTLTQEITQSEMNDDMDTFLQYYAERAISMPEYQLTLNGRAEIEAFYKEIFKRQNIKLFQRHPDEYVHMDSTIIEIGTFKKEYTDSKPDSLVTLTGIYWNVWANQHDGNYKLKGEAFGYFHSVKNPEKLVVSINGKQPDESEILMQKEIPFELKACNALMEKGVRTRDGVLRSGFFTENGSFKPFADTTVTGIENIRSYLISYSNRGTVTIDSIMCYTYDFEYGGEYIVEYDMFKVKWHVPDLSGRTEGKGIRIWKRQDDHSLRLFREIGTHNHLQ